MNPKLKKSLPAIIIIAAVAVAVLLKLSSGDASRDEAKPTPVYVETIAVDPQDKPAVVSGSGEVVPAKKISVIPQVSGKIVSVSEELVPGSRVGAGEVLARVDPSDYRLAIEQEKSRVRQAELELQLEQGRGEIARQEWDLLGEANQAEDDAGAQLALRRPQLEVARTAVTAARSALERARLNLQRTVLTAPFNAIVLEKNADVGQLVGPSAPIATLLGADHLWVRVFLPVDKLSLIDIPGVNTDGPGSKVIVYQNLGNGERIEKEATVLRLEGQLEPQTRTAGLLLDIENPFEPAPNAPPLLPGAYVNVDIIGKVISDVVTLPSEVIYEGSYVWLVSENLKLQKRPVEVAFKRRETVNIVSGLNAGERVVSSLLSSPLEGMPVTIARQQGEGLESGNKTK